MITKIGIISGHILELLDQNNDVLVYGEVHSHLNQPRDLVLMSLGWLLQKGYVRIVEDPLRAKYRGQHEKSAYTSEACMFDLVVGHNAIGPYSQRVKDLHDHIETVAGKILVLLEGCGGLLDLRAIENHMKEPGDMVLMALGWLIREECVRGISGVNQIFLFRLSKNMEKSKTGSLSYV